MNKLFKATLLTTVFVVSSHAQTITQTFGSGSDQFTMDFVTIGNPGNAADTTGSPNPAGSVSYVYNLGKYEVSRDQINKANAIGFLGITLADMSSYGGSGVDRPAPGITWYEAAKFVNWLNASSGSAAAYKFDGSGNFQLWSSTDAGYDANNRFRNSLAKYVIASRDEWYKGAYGKLDGSWSNFPNGSDTAPTAVAGGTGANTAVYNGQSGPADVTNAGGLSAYGTMGQGGNASEWNETASDGINDSASENRESRGGTWSSLGAFGLDASIRGNVSPTDDNFGRGFRVAMVPEPSSASLLIAGTMGLLAFSRRQKR